MQNQMTQNKFIRWNMQIGHRYCHKHVSLMWTALNDSDGFFFLLQLTYDATSTSARNTAIWFNIRNSFGRIYIDFDYAFNQFQIILNETILHRMPQLYQFFLVSRNIFGVCVVNGIWIQYFGKMNGCNQILCHVERFNFVEIINDHV